MKKLLLLTLLAFITIQINAEEYPKVILSGDYPDPSIMREGKDYYMTHSPFYYAPGFLIWHSQDLINWEPVCRACPEYEGSAMAPDLLKYKDRYYIYYPTSTGENYVIYADNIRGPWSKPVKLDVKGIDPGHVVGEDGHRYLFTNNGWVAPLSDDGLKIVGENKKVYDGWIYPQSWETEGNDMYLESPKLLFKEGYYYMTSAEGGTAGPATSHMCVMARSKSVFGPWENSPYNPVIHTYSATDNWWSKGHGTLVDDVNGNWWMVYHAYAKGYHTLGRQTLIEPMEYSSDGWFRPTPSTTSLPISTSIKHGLKLNDNFEGSKLGMQWTFWKEYAPDQLSFKNNTLWVNAKGNSPADGRLLLITTEDKCYEIQVDVQVGKSNKAGLVLFYNEKAFAGVVSDGKSFTVYRNAGQSETLPNKIGREFTVKLLNQGNKVKILVSKDGNAWTTLIEDVDVSNMHHNKFKGFFALRAGLLSAGKGSAGFKQFRYRNAVPQEKDMSAYLMVCHRDETHGLYMAISRDGYTFTALNDGEPVMAGDTIAYQRGIRDPHIYRGPDGAFYLAMTDLHVFAKRDGYRETEWERDGKIYAWGNNRGLVLMKSWDLINWKRTNVRFDQMSAAMSEIGCAWAPEVTYDERKGKLMIYFTMRFKNEANKLYYVYVNDDFDTIETLPQILFEYPNEKVSAIDGDITKVGDKYHLFYVAHDGLAGIKYAVSDRANGGYEYGPRWYDFEPKSCEAPNVWKRIGEDKWVLMYDVYSITPHNFAFIETSDFVNFKNLGHFNEGVMKTTNFTAPKHGAIIHITAAEADKLENYWKQNKRKYVSTASSPIGILYSQSSAIKHPLCAIEKVQPFLNSDVTLKPSWIEQRASLNLQYLKSLEPDRLLHNFRVNAGLPSFAKPLEGWEAPTIGLRGHFVGHYLSALASIVESHQDTLLSNRLKYMVAELYKCQQALGNGYLSAFPEADFDKLETTFGGVWAPYYTYHKIMQGLLDAYVRTGNDQAYQIVVGMADYVGQRMAKLTPETIEKVLYSVGANPSNEPGAMNEVLYKLYEASGNPKHLALAKIFDRDWFSVPLSKNKDILSGLHSNTHLVLVNGFACRYAITGEELYRDATLNFWNMLMKDHAYANGSSSGPRPNVVTPTSLSAEHWGVPGHLSNTMTKEIAESCVSHNTQKLTSTLFTWTAEPKYADAYMNTFYNAVLALQNAHTGDCVYHLPLGSPRHKAFLKKNDFRCCNGSSIEAFALLNSGIYYHDDSCLWVNLYVPSAVQWKEKNVTIEQNGSFPDASTVDFTLSVKKKSDFRLNLFIPSWAQKVDVYINDELQKETVSPMSYMNIHRQWKNRDRLKMVFHYDFHLKTMPDDENVIALYYGPVLLAFETPSELVLKGSHADILNNLTISADHTFHLCNNGKEYLLRPLYEVDNESYGVYATLFNH